MSAAALTKVLGFRGRRWSLSVVHCWPEGQRPSLAPGRTCWWEARLYKLEGAVDPLGDLVDMRRYKTEAEACAAARKVLAKMEAQ